MLKVDLRLNFIISYLFGFWPVKVVIDRVRKADIIAVSMICSGFCGGFI